MYGKDTCSRNSVLCEITSRYFSNNTSGVVEMYKYLHTTLNITPISDFIYHLTDKFFGSCPAHPNPLILSIGNNSLADLHHQYKKYIHKRPKHILL